MNKNKIAILVVSFGTSHQETLGKTIGAIECAIERRWPEVEVRRAFTSSMILRILKQRDALHIDNVSEALERLRSDGYTHVLIQPTHMINGEEYEKMRSNTLAFEDRFQKIEFGAPLLTSSEDLHKVCLAVCSRLSKLSKNGSLPSRDAFILMGHGTSHFTDTVYAAMDYRLKAMGFPNIFVGTVEGYPSLEEILPMVRQLQPNRVVILPFMLVAGDHAKKDMGGEEPDSWRSIFQSEGYDVTCIFEGLGESSEIQNIYLQHVEDSMSRLLSTT